MLSGMIGSHELSATVFTCVWLVAGVHLCVSPKLIRTKTSVAFPFACVSLTCMLVLVLGVRLSIVSHTDRSKTLELGIFSQTPFSGPRSSLCETVVDSGMGEWRAILISS